VSVRDTLRRHPRHLALAALCGGLLLAGHPVAAGAGGLFAAAAVVTWLRPAPTALVAALVVLLPAGALAGSARLGAIDRSDLVSHAGSAITLRGHVVKRERQSFGTARFRVRSTALRVGGRWRPAAGLVQIRVRGSRDRSAPAIGDEVEAVGQLAEPSRQAEESGYAAFLRRAGVRVVLHAERLRPTGRRRGGLSGAIDAVRRRAEEGVGAGLGADRAALARGMVLGADEDIPERMADDFKRSGLAHLLAVSGQNVTLLAVLAWTLLGAAGVSRGPRLWTVVVLVALYVPLTGAGPSIVRAGAMGIAGTLAALAGRPASRWYGLLVACAVTLALDPRAWQDVGWQLSFAAVVGIFALVRPLGQAMRPLPEPVRSGAALTLAATLATAPLMAFHFERASLAALPANLAALPAVAPVMWLGMLSAVAAQLAIEPAILLNAVNGFCLAHVAAIARFGAELPGAAIDVRIGSARALASIYAAGAAALWGAVRLGRRHPGRLSMAGALVLVCAAGVVFVSGGAPAPPREFTVTFLDVGQGDATLLQTPDGAAVLVDGGPPGTGLEGKLRDRGVRSLDVVVLTHAQEDHQGGFADVLESFEVGLLLDGGVPDDGAEHRRIVSLARARRVEVRASRAGQRLRVGRELRLRVMSAAEADSSSDVDPNLRATVMTASYGSFDVFLPADAESEVTGGLALADVEVMKVAHHGSEDPGLPELLERLRPEVSVIEVGTHNRFGHPRPATLAALRAAGSAVHRTDRDGAVTVTLERGEVRVKSDR
jgi:competence protein ComEC